VPARPTSRVTPIAPMMPTIIDTLCDIIRAGSSFLLVTHVEPDGDGIGAALALAHALRQLRKSARVWLPKGVPDKYRFLPGTDEVVLEGGPEPTVLVLDCDNAERLGEALPTVRQCERVVNIDHHAATEPFGDVNWLDPASPAAGFQVLQLIRALGAPITREIAVCLYCAVGTDSGFFRYSNTTPELLRAAAELIEAGADPKAIAEATLDRYPPAMVRLAGCALASLTVRLDGSAAVTVLTNEDYGRAGTRQTEGIIDFLRTVAGVDLLVLMREDAEGWRVSLRSLGAVDVGAAVRKLGGGGHAAAAGCTLQGDVGAVWSVLEGVLREARGAAARNEA